MSTSSAPPPSQPSGANEPESLASVSRQGSLASRVVPWAVALGLLAYIFSTTDLARVAHAAASANWLLFWLAAFGIYVGLFLADSFSIWWVYRRRHVDSIRFADVLPARGASYLLGILNYAAGSAAMALYFRKKFGVGAIEGGASLLLLMLVDLGLVLSAVLLGGALLPPEWADWARLIRISGALFALAVVAHLVFWRAPWSWGPLERVRAIPSFRGFREAPVADYVKLAALRAPVTALYVLIHGATLVAFHIHVPWQRLLVYVPIQMFIAVVPISPSGLGTINVVQRYLYAPYVFDAAGNQLVGADALAHIDAYALALALAFNVPRAVFGLVALRVAERALSETTPRANAPDPAEPT